METGEVGLQSHRLKLLLVVGVVLLVRVPFLNQAIQGDDVYYLAEAEHAQIEPLHPTHFHYVFQGISVDMRGHSHPPLNGWILAMLLAAFSDISEVPFHAVYILFSVIAALSMWSLAQRWSPHPLWATLLFVVVPVFIVNGNSLESDVPFLAFWTASIALFVSGRHLAAAAAMVLAALTAYQAVFLTPILALYLWLFDRKRRIAWTITLVPLATLLGYQIFERLTLGSAPAAVLAGYLNLYGLTALRLKLRSAAALALHGCWLVCPLLLPPAAVLLWHARRDRKVIFLIGWIAIFLVGATVVFFAGSARYVLPIAAPVVLLASALRPGWLAAGFFLQLTLALALAVVNYQHWDAYRRFAATLPTDHRIWISGDWGLRYYVEAEGGLPLKRLQTVRPGDIVVTNALDYPIAFNTGGGKLVPLSTMQIRPALALRLNALHTRSAWADAQHGLLPFEISSGLIDIIRAEEVVAHQPTRSDMMMSAPDAAEQIVSGVYEREGAMRWMSGRAVILLKAPPQPERLRVALYIPDSAPARNVSVLLDGVAVAAQTYTAPGSYVLQSDAPVTGQTVTIAVDKTFSTRQDSRELGIVLTAVGFVP